MSIKRTIITTATIVVAVAMVASVAGAQTSTIAQLQAEIAQLTAQLAQLSGGQQTAGTGGTGACVGITFTRNLVVGSTGSDVKCLQQILNQTASTQVSATGAGSPGNETSYFGVKTLAAVKIYQANNGYTPANQVGPLTRAKLNAYLAGNPNPNPNPNPQPTGSISVQLALDNPASGAIVGGQAQADLMHLNFTGTGTVTSITLQRSGISDNSLFDAIYLYDGNTRITGGYSFNSTSSLTMNGLSIAVNGSHVISVRGDVDNGTAACGVSLGISACESTVVMTVTGFTANGTITSANVMGNSMMVASGTLATANLLHYAPGTPTVQAGSTNQTLWTRNITISPRAVLLKALTVKMIGSAPSNTLANVGLYVDSTMVRSATINSNNQFVFDATSSPITLTTGQHLIEVRGDVVAGSSRSFYLSLEQGSDIAIQDSQLGVNIAATCTDGNTNINGDTFTINGTSGGSIIVSQDPAFSNTTTIVGGATNTTMASFKFTAYGEDEKITELKFTPTVAGTPEYLNGVTPTSITTGTLANVGLYVNGGQVGSNQTGKSGSVMTFSSLGSNLLIPAGTSVIVSIKGDAITGPVGDGTAQGTNNPYSANYYQGTVVFNPTADTNNAQGQSSMQLITVPTSAGGQTLTISSANVNFAGTTGFAAVAAAPNNTMVHIGSFSLSTGSAEGVTINNIAVSFPSSSTMVGAPYNDLTNLVVEVNGSTVGSTIGQPATGANNYSTSTNVAVSSSAMIDVYGDFGSLTSCGGNCTVTPVMVVSYRGLTSGTSNTATATPGITTTAAVSAIADAGVTTVASSSLSAQFVSGNGSSTLPIVTFNVVATSALGGAVIQNMSFTTVSNTIQSVTVNGKTANITSGTGVIYNVGITVPSTYSGVNIPVTVKLVCVGTGCSGVSNAPVALTLSQITYNNGASVQTQATTHAYSSTLSLVGSVPTISLTGSSTTGLAVGTQQIGVFTITAGSGGDLGVKQIPVSTSVSSSITGLTSIELRDASGNILTGVSNQDQSGTGAINFTFTTPRTIAAGTSETYTVYGTVASTGGLGTAGQSNISFSMGAKGSFLFTDIVGNSGNIAGTNIYNYPTATQTRTN